MADKTYLKEDLVALRKDLGLTQQEMASHLEMALRSYQAIESGESGYRLVHRLAAERVALQLAVDRGEPHLAPPALRNDAIELVRLGQATGNPDFLPDLKKVTGAISPDKFRAAYSMVGELILLTSALDHQLNHILIQVLSLVGSPLLEAVVATLDMNRKIEMLKARSGYITNPAWRKPLQDHLEMLEQISKWRNLACHTVLIPDDKYGLAFAPVAAAKLLKNLELGENPGVKKTPVEELASKIKLAESALAKGEALITNFAKMNSEVAKRSARSALI